MDYFLCLEAALKLKEISYIQTEGFAAGEKAPSRRDKKNSKIPSVPIGSMDIETIFIHKTIYERQAIKVKF